jgi:hypothetical protein
MDSKVVLLGLIAVVLVTSGCLGGDGAQPSEELDNPDSEEGMQDSPDTGEESDLEGESGDTSDSETGDSPTEGLE